jgi:hypothetical protein
MDEEGRQSYDKKLTFEQSVNYGFTLHPDIQFSAFEGWSFLTECWVEQIEKRLANSGEMI